MEYKSFKKTQLAATISMVLGAVAMTPAHGQSNDQEGLDQLEEIVVTGIRGSLQRSMDIKRDAQGVVDAISAEDIGKMPDTNLAESLQRITGVSIDRSRGEGSKVTVRGFGPDYNLVTLNGRQLPTASGTSRSFDFANLAAEGVAGVEVFKSGKANMPTGGIGSTINIKTTRPLESPGMVATVGVKGVHDTSTRDGDALTPEISGLFSNTFADDTVGIALSASRQERDSGAATASVGGWRTFPGEVDNCWCTANPSEWGGIPPEGDPNQVNRPGAGDIYSVPQTIGYELAEYNRVRTNGQLTVQWQPVDSVRATLDYTYSEVEVERTYNNMSAWFNFGAQETVWTDGPIASPLVYTENLGGSDFSMGAGKDATRTENNSVGFNVEWNATESLTLAFDHHDSTAESSPNSPYGDSALLSIAAFTRDKTTGYFDSDLPILELGLANPLSPDDMQITGSVFTHNVSKMDIQQSKFSGNFEFVDNSLLESIDFGIEFTEVNNRSAGAVVQRDAWSNTNTAVGAIADLMQPLSIAGEFDSVSGGGNLAQTDFYGFDMVQVINRFNELVAAGDGSYGPMNGLGDCGTPLCASTTFTSDRRTTEESQAAYVQLNMATEIADMPARINVGLRHEQTDVTSSALVPSYSYVTWGGGNELTAVAGAESEFTTLTGDYGMLLPNIDFSLSVTEDIVTRASWSKTIGRPNYADIQGGVTINNPLRSDGGTGSRGNPALDPLESENTDLSVEWYYAEGSYASVGYFHKNVKNFIGTDSVTEQVFSLPSPANSPMYAEAIAAGNTQPGEIFQYIVDNYPNAEGVDVAGGNIVGVAGRDGFTDFTLSVPANLEKAVVDGWELNVQHAFGESGFGVIANATLVDADVGYDDFSLESQFVVTGLSDSANLIGYYDKDGIQVRIAYNWRDDFLAGTGQANVGVGPTYVAAYGQWDMNASYEINENATVFVEALNVTDETTHVYGRDKMQTLFAAQIGPRFAIGARYKF
ncbi:TonB-dependent receptor [Simiduia aestuariiviva]|uniref:TonB-dependent receptor n=1 Tax=Simiduia aestuariiviva TaxID=1510459 RepID=A0A839UKR5_9GAMM|nr:TonB-dependent receptor [Simiduia aestuariiviva]MBB3167361.1 TonB-dependent receptor [Simiduia aestuariiviva]